MSITYELGEKIYINLTNRCNNDCKFCVRKFKDGVGNYNLWLEEEPTAKEVIDELKLQGEYTEIVFCGYGEPLLRLDTIIEISKFINDNHPKIPIRINTNGQANLYYQHNILPQLSNLIASISISLNASNKEAYQELCQPDFGLDAFPAVIEFIREAKKYISDIVVSIVTYPTVDIVACRKLAKNLDVELKVRYF